MRAPGKAVILVSGKRGVLPSGKAAVYDTNAACSPCCSVIQFSQQWTFTDLGFINGGQNGAFRAYNNPADVPASPWSIFNGGLGLRLDFEDDINCRNHNPYTQRATANATIVVPRAMIMTVNWSGEGERQNEEYDVATLFVDGGSIGSAHAPGGGLECAGGMGPVVSDPPPPQQVLLAPGSHTLHIDAGTNDPLYHFGAWYRFDLTFANAP